jgi:DNA-binding transcriptional LysR family regulator
MFNINELVVFLTAAEYGNFSEAGRQLHISQPAVSQTIDNLQKHFGTKLFMRHGRTVRLTDAGHVLLPMAKELLASAKRIDETMMSLQGEVIGEMNVGCSTASGKYLLPGLIARFRLLFPQVRINVIVSNRESVINKLLAGDCALVVSSKRVEHRDIEYHEFFNDDVILIAPAEHPWAEYRMIYTDDLLEEPLILREEVAGTREILMENLRQRDILPEMLNVAMVLGNAEAIEMAVEEGIGVAFISRLAATRGLELGRIVEVNVQGMLLQRRIYLARNRRFPSTRAQSEFWKFVVEQTRILEPVF